MNTRIHSRHVFALAGFAAAITLGSCGRQDGGTTVTVAGSDTMLQVGLSWGAAYKDATPGIAVSVAGEGSSTGFKALIDNTADIAHSSRAIKPSEAESIKAKYGKDAVEHIVGYDGIAVYVHKENPVKSISLAKLKEIWGEGGSIENWSQLGGSNNEIKRAGRANNSGTYGFFQKAVLGKGVEFKPDTAAMNGSSAVVEFCSTTPSAIGYSGMSYMNEHVGALSISAEEGSEAIDRPAALHLHRRGADRRGEGLPRLDQGRRRPAGRRGSGIRAVQIVPLAFGSDLRG
jgi:phosphate transport system substrate-binding protein